MIRQRHAPHTHYARVTERYLDEVSRRMLECEVLRRVFEQLDRESSNERARASHMLRAPAKPIHA